MEESPTRNISATEPVSLAIDRAKMICFEPFNAGKWFGLGFCVFLAYLFEGGGANFNLPNSSSGPGGKLPPEIQDALNWMQAHVGLMVFIVMGVILVLFLLGQVFVWLRCRGLFMLIDGVVHNRGLVVQPWRQFAHLGNSLFQFTFVFGLVGLLGGCMIVALGVGIAWGDISTWGSNPGAWRFGGLTIAALCVSGLLYLAWSIGFMIISAILHHLVVPVMYARNLTVIPAWQLVRQELLPGNAGPIAIFFLLKIAAVFVMSIGETAACCLTCCLGTLPYISRVLLLPLHVFNISFTLYFVEQFGPQWKIFPDQPPPAPLVEGGHYEPPQIAPPPTLPDRPPPLPPEPPKPPPMLPLD